MKVMKEVVRKIDWGLLAIIVCVAGVVFSAARIGSIGRDDVQSDEIKRVEEKLDRLFSEIQK